MDQEENQDFMPPSLRLPPVVTLNQGGIGTFISSLSSYFVLGMEPRTL